jgi:hypothetical protein
LRPHCCAKDRLRLWIPLSAKNAPTEDSAADPAPSVATRDRIREVKSFAWAGSTQEAYGTGLLNYIVFCDEHGIPEEKRAPASPLVIQSFIATLAGAYASSTIVNFVCGVRAWHIMHGIPWSVNKEETDAMLKGAHTLAPASSRRASRPPVTTAMIKAIRDNLDLTDPLHAATFACLTTSFWGTARLGETTVTALNKFDPAIHVKRSDVRKDMDRGERESTVFKIPSTKAEPLKGEEIYWMSQIGPADPEEAFKNHLKVNTAVPEEGPLFGYNYKGGWRPLTRSAFLKVTKIALAAAGLPPLQGHGIRIGSALEYLLRGTPFDVMKTKGRWASDAFQTYLREHAQIVSAYMQAVPETHEAFTRYTMPTLRR